MSETIVVNEPILQGYTVRCENCGVSKTYHTELGVKYFKDMHEGHVISTGQGLEEPRFENDLTRSEAAEPIASNALDVLSNANEIAKEVYPEQSEAKQKADELLQVETESNTEKLLVRPASPEAESSESKVSVVHVRALQEESLPEEELCVLLSKFSFVKEGERYARESIRVSQALMELRWKIEPPYVISALFDDNLGIESSTGSIARELLSKMEEIGYRFVAMEAPKGVPT
ncbi:MAG: hypothetical protein JRN52_08230, partial [Nitrososphaerota archaeon]|nr:hypothetical protein [Nitrososphaerota archaeon]